MVHPQQLVQHAADGQARVQRRSTGPGRPSGSSADRHGTAGRAGACHPAVSRRGLAAAARSSARASVDLPDPDSPTRASASPRSIRRSTPSTACSTRASCRNRAASADPSAKLTDRSRASRSGAAGSADGTLAIAAAWALIGRLPPSPIRPGARNAGRRWPARRRSAVAAARSRGSPARRTCTWGGTGSPTAGSIRLGGDPGMATSDERGWSTSGADRTSPSVYGWQRPRQYLLDRATLDDLPGVHDRELVADLGDDRQVVRDEDQAVPRSRGIAWSASRRI